MPRPTPRQGLAEEARTAAQEAAGASFFRKLINPAAVAAIGAADTYSAGATFLRGSCSISEQPVCAENQGLTGAPFCGII